MIEIAIDPESFMLGAAFALAFPKMARKILAAYRGRGVETVEERRSEE